MGCGKLLAWSGRHTRYLSNENPHNQWNFYTVDDRKIGYGLKPYNPILIQ